MTQEPLSRAVVLEILQELIRTPSVNPTLAAAERCRFVFRQFHIEGFVNTYVQEETGDLKKLVFVGENIKNIAPGWRARDAYLISNENEFIKRFEIAEPGRDFALCSEAHLKRTPQEQWILRYFLLLRTDVR